MKRNTYKVPTTARKRGGKQDCRYVLLGDTTICIANTPESARVIADALNAIEAIRIATMRNADAGEKGGQ